MGYEVMERPANMNTTYGILFNVMPLYYTGVLSSYRFDDYLDGKLGVVNGSNSDNNTTLNPNSGDGCAVLASLNVTAPGGNANWSNNFQYSTGYDNNTSTGSTNSSLTSSSQPARANNGDISAYMLLYNSWGNWAPKFANDKLLLAFNTVFGNLSGVADGVANVNTHWYGAGLTPSINSTTGLVFAAVENIWGAITMGSSVTLARARLLTLLKQIIRLGMSRV